MKYIELYKNVHIEETEQKKAFDYLVSNFKNTIRGYDFFVYWEKVFKNISKIEISLNILNSLIGKQDIDVAFKELVKKYPEVILALPILLAVREEKIYVLEEGEEKLVSFLKKEKYSNEDIDEVFLFCANSGLLEILASKKIKNLVDYCIGIEVGLDSNARKNRSGTLMEELIEVYVSELCEKNNYRYLVQATVSMIKKEFGVDVPTDKADRHFDFAVFNGLEVFLIEVNFYSGGGSKLKSVAGEFSTLSSLIRTSKSVKFIWVTDGKGWETARRPLLEAFDIIDYIFNIKMIEDGFFEEVITKGL